VLHNSKNCVNYNKLYEVVDLEKELLSALRQKTGRGHFSSLIHPNINDGFELFAF